MGKALGAVGVVITVIVVTVAAVVVFGAASGDDGASTKPTTSPYRTYTYRVEVPPGTAEKVKLGQRELYMALSLDLHVGDTLELINNDSVVQAIGPFRARPGETVRHTFLEPIETVGECTFEPGGMPVYIRVTDADGSPPLIDGKPWAG